MRSSDQSPSRRNFFRGEWASETSERRSPPGATEIVSLIVNAWPAHVTEVETAIIALGNAEIYARDVAKGKIVVVLEAASQAEIGAKANLVSGLPHVLSSVMVFQASDDGQEVS